MGISILQLNVTYVKKIWLHVKSPRINRSLGHQSLYSHVYIVTSKGVNECWSSKWNVREKLTTGKPREILQIASMNGISQLFDLWENASYIIAVFSYLSNRALFSIFTSPPLNMTGFGEFEAIMQTADEVEGLPRIVESNELLSCLYKKRSEKQAGI